LKSKTSTNLSKKPVPALVKMLKKERDLQQDIYEALKQRKEEALAYLEKQFLKKFEEGKFTWDLEFYLVAMGKIADSEKDLELFQEKIKDSRLHKIILFYILEFVEKIESIDWLKEQYSEDLSHLEKQMFYLTLARHSKDPADFREALEFFIRGYLLMDKEQAVLASASWIQKNGLDKLEDYLLNAGLEEFYAIRKALELILEDDTQQANLQQIKASIKNVLKKALKGNLQQQKNALRIILVPQEEYNDILFDYLNYPNFWVKSVASQKLLLDKENDSLKALDVIDSDAEKSIKVNLLSKINVSSGVIEGRMYKIYQTAEAYQKFWILISLKNNIERINKDKFINLLKENLQQEDAFAVRYLSANMLKEFGEFSDDLIESWLQTEKLLFEIKHTREKTGDVIEQLLDSGDDLIEPLLGVYAAEKEDDEWSRFIEGLIKQGDESLIHKIIEFALKNEEYTIVAAELARYKPTLKTAEFLINKALKAYEKDDEWQFYFMCDCLAYHHDYRVRVRIADALLPLIEKASLEYLLKLVQTLADLKQPRLLPRLMKRIEKGDIYGFSFNLAVKLVSQLCFEKKRAREYILRVSEHETGLKKRFAQEVLISMEEIEEEMLNEYDEDNKEKGEVCDDV